jgi:hypothetical protein
MGCKIILHSFEPNIWPPVEQELLCKALQSHYDAVDSFAKLPHVNLDVRDV